MKKYRTYGAKEGQDLEMKNRNISFVWQTLFPFSKKNQLQNILFFISHQLLFNLLWAHSIMWQVREPCSRH
jgi:hypothetical protein